MLHVKIVTPNGLYKECDADSVNARSVEGQFGILPNHVPLVAMLDISKLEIVKNNEKNNYAIAGGIFHLKDNQVYILTDSIEGESEIDAERAKRAKERAEKRLAEKSENINLKRAEISLKKAINRINIKEGAY